MSRKRFASLQVDVNVVEKGCERAQVDDVDWGVKENRWRCRLSSEQSLADRQQVTVVVVVFETAVVELYEAI